MRYVHKLIEYPEALQVMDFADGRVSLVAVRATAGGLLVGHTVHEIKDLFPLADMRVVALYRQDTEVRDLKANRILAGDEVFVLAATEHIRDVLTAIHRKDRPVERLMIAGGRQSGPAPGAQHGGQM
jgi:trk system potassium uptake protein TrkA